MRSGALSIHPGLAAGSRLPLARQTDAALRLSEVAVLLGAGAAAAGAAAFLDFGLRVPGHAIIRVVLPMSLGLALAPRRMAGLLMGLSAAAATVLLKVGGAHGLGVGAVTGLVLVGPLMDLALWRARHGSGVYLGLALAGLGANLAAMAARAGSKLAGLDHAAARPLAAWLPQAAVTYAVCGIAAGLICSLMWFKFTAGKEDGPAAEPSR